MSSATEDPQPEVVQTENQPEIMTADELAKLLRVNRKTIYSAFRNGEIPGGRRVGGTIRFARSRVLRWIADGQEHDSRSPRGAR